MVGQSFNTWQDNSLISITKRVGQYTFEHKAYLTSKISDYDYDTDNPNRRFISNYVHKVCIYDLCGSIFFTFTTNSEPMYCLITSLIFKSKYNKQGNICCIDINDDNTSIPYKLNVIGDQQITKILIAPTSIQFDPYSRMISTLTLSIPNKDLDDLITVLKFIKDGKECLNDYV